MKGESERISDTHGSIMPSRLSPRLLYYILYRPFSRQAG